MTLVQVLSDEHAIHMACDFRLTQARNGAFVQDHAHKLINTGSVLIGVTGLANLGGVPVGEWIADLVGGMPPVVQGVDDAAQKLRDAATSQLALIADASVRRTTFVVAGFVGTQSRISIVSNFEVMIDGRVVRSELAAPALGISSIRPKSALYFTTGVAGVVPSAQLDGARTRLRAGAPDEDIQTALAELNSAASRATPAVSEGCHTSSLHVSGHGTSKAFLTDAQSGDHIPPEVASMFHRAGLALRAVAPDGAPVPIRIENMYVGSIGSGDAYFHGQLKLQPDNAELWNNYGADLSRRRRFDEAIAAYTRACELDAEHAVAHLNLAGRLWDNRKDATGASEFFARAFEIWGDSAPPWALASYANFRHTAIGDAVGALDLYEQAARIDNYPLGKAKLANFLLRTGGDHARAESLLEEAYTAAPTDPDVLLIVGSANWHDLAKPETGRAQIEQACSMAPHRQDVWLAAGDACLTFADGATAAYYYRKGVDRGAAGWQVQLAWGLALLLSNKPDGALRHMREAEASVEEGLGPQVDINIAAALWAKGERLQAVARLHRILEGPELEPSWEVEVYAMLLIAGEGNHQTKLEELTAQGVTSDALTLMGMVAAADSPDRERAQDLARLIGAAPSVVSAHPVR